MDTGIKMPRRTRKATQKLREVIKEITENYYFDEERFKEDMQRLRPVDRVNVMIKLTEFVMPKLSSVQLDATVEQRTSVAEKFSGLAEEVKVLEEQQKN